jgi:hypothetical protein
MVLIRMGIYIDLMRKACTMLFFQVINFTKFNKRNMYPEYNTVRHIVG